MKQIEIGFATTELETEHLKDIIAELTATGDYKVIRRLRHVECYAKDSSVNKQIGVYLDTETTGMDPEKDRIIEIALVPFEYDDAGNIYRVLPAYNALQDPGFPIPELITKITHITDDMVRGQAISWDIVSEVLSTASLVVAHNARFDRPFVENMLEDFKTITWGCSIADVEWNEEGFEGVKLDYLAYKHGFFYEGHRATIDCLAGIEILHQTLPVSGATALFRVIQNANRVDVRLWAEGAPFDKKDELRLRGYRWSPGDNGKPKAWYRDLPESELDKEMAFLKAEIYRKEIKRLPQERITGLERYSKRI